MKPIKRRVRRANMLLTTSPSWETGEPDEIARDFEALGFADNEASKLTPQEIRKMTWNKMDEELQRELKDNEITGYQYQKLREMLASKVNAFGIDQAHIRMSNMTPMRVEIAEGETPCRAKARNLGPQQLQYLREKLETLEKIGMITPAPHATWSSPVFVVPKSTKGQWRMVVDMRELNKKVVKTALGFPNMEAQLAATKNAKYYGMFDVLSGFDMLRTEADSVKYFGITTVFGTYHLLGTPMGFVNTPAVYSDRMIREIMRDLFMREHAGVIQWLDDTTLYSDNFDNYLGSLETMLDRAIEKNLRFSVKKCRFLNESATWCGRTLSRGSWTFSDEFYQSITEIVAPTTGLEVGQALYISNWLAPTIPRLAELSAPLREVTKRIYDEAGTRKNKALLGKQLINYGWGEDQNKAWSKFREAIHNASRMAAYDANKALCVLSDSSDQFYAGVITQCSYADLEKPLPEQQHKPLFFLSGKFNKTEVNWHISQKELFPIMAMYNRFDFLLGSHDKPVVLYCDHYNLKSILRPSKEISKTTLGRLNRWSISLQEYDFSVKQTTSADNFFADALSRWASPHNPVNRNCIRASRSQYSRASPARDDDAAWREFMGNRLSPLSPLYDGPEDFSKMLESDFLLKEQLQELKHWKSRNPPVLKDGLYRFGGKVWIPRSLTDRFLVSIHMTTHATERVMMKQLSEFYFSEPIGKKVKRLLQVCLHCERHTRKIRRRFGETIHSSKRGGVIHADYLYVFGTYLLVMRDDLSGKIELLHTQNADAAATAEGLAYWKARYSLPSQTILVTDGGSHFSNKLIARLSKALRIQHNITVSYSPWTNGVAEVSNRTVLRSLKTLMSERGLQNKEWPKLLPEILHFCNNRPNINGYTPNQIFLGLSKEYKANPIAFKVPEICNTPLSKEQLIKTHEAIRKELSELGKRTFEIKQLLREQSRRTLNKRSGINDIQYAEGDFVLVSSSGVKREPKTQLTWKGPYAIEEVLGNSVYIVKGLDGKKKKIHSQRMQFYDSGTAKMSSAVKEHFLNTSGDYEVDSIKDIRYSERLGYYEVLVHWSGFEEDEDTWEDVENIDRSLVLNSVEKWKLTKPAARNFILTHCS